MHWSACATDARAGQRVTELRTAEARFRRLIDAVAAYEQLPWFSYRGDTFTPGELLEGLILTESSGNPQARRYEPHQDATGRKDAAKDPDAPGVDNGHTEDDASYGLCQVMGYTLKGLLELDRPARLNFTLLYRPLFGLAAGVEVLKREISAVFRAHPIEDENQRTARALARYNGGPTGDAWDVERGAMRLHGYVEKVAANARRAQDDRREKNWRAA
jgi:hypothetical protein